MALIHGKQKDIRTLGGNMLEFKFTDRTTVFDVKQPFMIPNKGVTLAQTNRHWFDMGRRIGIETHFVSMSDLDKMIVEQAKPVDLEFITRYYVEGSLWRRVQSGEIGASALGFPEGHNVARGDKLPGPVFDITTKREDVDRLLTEEEALRIGKITEKQLGQIREAVLGLDEELHRQIRGSGLLHFDGKKEVAIDDKRGVIIIDSFGNADEDRYVDEEAYNEGRIIEKSKELFRRHYMGSESDFYYSRLKEAREMGLADPELPLPTERLIAEGMQMYVDVYERLTGNEFAYLLRSC